MVIAILFFLQVPAIEEVRSATIEGTDCRLLMASQTGKYLLLGRPGSIEVYTAADLTLAKKLDLSWTAAGFDEDDQHLEIVGKELVRFRPKDWAEISRHPLQDSEFLEVENRLRPRQAWMYPDGSVLYRSKDGGIRHADWDSGKLVSKLIVSPDVKAPAPIVGIVGLAPKGMILDLGRAAGVLSVDTVYYLICSHRTFFAGGFEGDAVLVGTEFEATYNPRTWRLIASRSEEEEGPVPGAYLERSAEGKRYAAAIDPKSGWVFIAGERGLRSWNFKRIRETERYPAIQGPCLQVAVDHSQRLLYSVQTTQVRCWKIREKE